MKYVNYMGKAGEYAVASQLFLRGTSVLWPAIDDGFDLMTSEGCRVQVKTSHIDGRTRKGENYYWFPMANTRQAARGKTAVRVPIPPMAGRCDVVVFWGIEDNRFWVVPVDMLKGTQGIALGSADPKRFAGSISEMRNMITLGYTRGAVAKHYGIERHSLQQFLDSGKDIAEVTTTSRVRACENAWHNILDFGQPAALDTQALAIEDSTNKEI